MAVPGRWQISHKELYDVVDEAGGFNNAFTRRTHAAFMMTVPVDRMNLGLDVQADMLFHSRFQPAKFEKERKIILASWRNWPRTARARPRTSSGFTRPRPIRPRVMDFQCRVPGSRWPCWTRRPSCGTHRDGRQLFDANGLQT